jgi:hypothetical protein
MGTKKGKGIPISNKTPLPVIVLSYYREKGKNTPISNRAIRALLLSSTPASALINSPQLAGTIDSVD